jgi:hypothetical protein
VGDCGTGSGKYLCLSWIENDVMNLETSILESVCAKYTLLYNHVLLQVI